MIFMPRQWPFEAKINPRDVIGSPPNFIMKLQLFKLWKDVLGAEDIGDFETFMKEASDLTYDEAKEKLFRTYGQPKQMTSGYLSAKASDAEARIHAGMCDSAAEECDKGNPEACRVACQDCGITEFCPPQPKKPEYSWRKFPDHKSETRAVKDALKKAGIEAEVKHGTGTAWGWLDINIGDPRKRSGLKPAPFGYQYTDEEQALQKKALKIAQEITGRHGDYDGRISVLAQEWRHKVRPAKEKTVEAAKPEPEIKPESKETVKPIVHHVKPVVQDRRLAQKLADITGMPVALAPAQEPVQKPRKAPGKATQPEMRAKPSTVIKKIPRSGVIRITEKDIRAGKIVLEW